MLATRASMSRENVTLALPLRRRGKFKELPTMSSSTASGKESRLVAHVAF